MDNLTALADERRQRKALAMAEYARSVSLQRTALLKRVVSERIARAKAGAA